jgi:hypothetical protein
MSKNLRYLPDYMKLQNFNGPENFDFNVVLEHNNLLYAGGTNKSLCVYNVSGTEKLLHTLEIGHEILSGLIV